MEMDGLQGGEKGHCDKELKELEDFLLLLE